MRYALGEDRPLTAVAGALGLPPGFADREPSDNAEAVQAAIFWIENDRPRRQNHWPALVLALTAQIDEALGLANMDCVDDFLEQFPQEQAVEGGVVNTFNVIVDGHPVRLRPLYNKALDVIRNVMLREHPSNAAHATQSWPAYRPLISLIGRLAPDERREFADIVWDLGVLEMPKTVVAEVQARVPRPFEQVLARMPTAVANVPGGAILQGLAYGYLRADSPNLNLESHKVNTGSSHAGIIGDVIGYRGREPELAAEVKDLRLTVEHIESTLADFLQDIATAPNVTPIVICWDADEESRTFLEARTITLLTRRDLAARVAIWDLPKQEEALRGVEYYLGRIQKSSRAVDHLRQWLTDEGLIVGMTLPLPEEPT